MNFLQLEYFLKVANTCNITKAAKDLYISQPSLSQTIHYLEQELNIKLFERDKKGTILTKEGEILKKYASIAINAMADAKKELSEVSASSPSLTLSITAATGMLPDIMTKFANLYPEIQLFISQANVSNYMENADLYIYSSLIPPSEDYMTVLIKESCYIGMSLDNPLSKEKKLSPAMLKYQNFLAMQGQLPLNRLTHDLCQKAGFSPNISLELDNRELIFSLVSLSKGITLVPIKTWAPLIHNDNIVLKKLDTPCYRYIILQWNPYRYKSKSMNVMINFLQDFFKNL